VICSCVNIFVQNQCVTFMMVTSSLFFNQNYNINDCAYMYLYFVCYFSRCFHRPTTFHVLAIAEMTILNVLASEIPITCPHLFRKSFPLGRLFERQRCPGRATNKFPTGLLFDNLKTRQPYGRCVNAFRNKLLSVYNKVLFFKGITQWWTLSDLSHLITVLNMDRPFSTDIF